LFWGWGPALGRRISCPAWVTLHGMLRMAAP